MDCLEFDLPMRLRSTVRGRGSKLISVRNQRYRPIAIPCGCRVFPTGSRMFIVMGAMRQVQFHDPAQMHTGKRGYGYRLRIDTLQVVC